MCKKMFSRCRSALHCCVLVVGAFFFIMGVVDSSASEQSESITYAWSTHVGPLDAHDYGANMMFAQAFVYEPLVQYGKGGEILPALATQWKVSEDKKEYVFTLRQGVTFSDGTAFDAKAVVENFDTVFKRKERHAWLGLIERIASYKAIDANTFSLTLTTPYTATLQELTFVRPLRFMSPKALLEKANKGGEFRPVGTGPWIWQERVKGQYDLFVRNEKYWNATKNWASLPKKLIVKVIPDTEARAVAFETGAVDVLATVMGDHGTADITPNAYALFSKDSAKYATTHSEPRNTRFIAMNSGVAPLNDKKVRQAIMRAIDRKSIVEKVLLGQELEAEQLMYASLPYCDVQLKPYGFDVTKAEALLDAAGWRKVEGKPFRQKNGKNLRLTLKFVAHESLQRVIAQVVQSNLAQVGIQLELVGQEGVAFMESQRVGNFDLVFGNSSGAPYAPFSYLSIMQVPGHPEYQAQKHIDEKALLDKAMADALQATEEVQLKEAFAKVWQIIHEAEVYVPLSFMVDKAIFPVTKVKSFQFAPVSYELELHKVEKLQPKK